MSIDTTSNINRIVSVPKLRVLLTILIMLLSSCSKPPRVTTPSDWADQLAVAEKEAQAIDQAVVLEHVLATAAQSHSEHQHIESLDVRFTFVRSSGSLIDVSFYDTAVSSPKVAVNGGRLTTNLSGEERRYLMSSLPSVRLSAADALDKATAEQTILTELSRFDAPAVVRLHLDKSIQETLGVQAAWSVLFSSSNAETLRVWIDASNGTILEIDGHK